ncbi:putative invertase inhibitor [Jatropha curcas]|uniref:putative invertase inhibitor n=1 Tax=Jatropha curcas TaxID=180498 RepID=UPI0005FC04DB|nr:putative invertase inhibitor [Jatropha curcas]
MDFTSKYQLIFRTAIFMLLIPNLRAKGSPSKLVQDICSETQELSQTKFEDCVNALEIDPKTNSADLKTLAHISLQLGISKANDTQTFIGNLLTSNKNHALQTCLFWYQAVIASFKSADKEIEEDPLTANYDAKIAGDDAKECEDELTREKAQIPSTITTNITTRNNLVRLYSFISFVITNRL